MNDYKDKVIETMAKRITDLERELSYKDYKIEELEKELAEYKKAELAAVGFGKDEVIK